MRDRIVRMFYCEHCQKKGQRRDVIAKHETRCTRNPLRLCGVCGVQYEAGTREALKVAAEGGIDALRRHAEGCPVCMVIGVNAALADMTPEYADDCNGVPVPLRNSLAFELHTWAFRDELASWWAEKNGDRFMAEGGIYGL